MLITHCPICNSDSSENFLICEDYTTSHEKFSLFKCSSCHFIFTSPQPDQESLGKYYQSDNYISHTEQKKNLIDIIYHSVRNVALRWKRKIVFKNSEGKQLLDFGCGVGSFLMTMKNSGWQTIGVEPSIAAAEKAAQSGKIYHDIIALKENNFDVITLWHVLEHLPDLNKKLNQLYNLLNDTGTVIIAVPNSQSYDAQYYQSFWAGYDVPRHLWHFNQTTMSALLQKTNFKLVKILPMPVDSFYVSLLSESYKNPARSKMVNLLKAIYIGLLSNLKARNKMNYSSLIFIAKK